MSATNDFKQFYDVVCPTIRSIYTVVNTMLALTVRIIFCLQSAQNLSRLRLV